MEKVPYGELMDTISFRFTQLACLPVSKSFLEPL